MQGQVDKAAKLIGNGTLKVHDYMSDETCPALSF
jgi:basic membrane protein A